ncbi:hypothetical protein BH10BAC2_BH10BAC2_02140 [soil metagenome]
MTKKEFEKHLELEFGKAKMDADKIWKLVTEDLQAPEALLNYQGNPLVFKNAMIMIQGKTGSHKSRLASAFASVLISEDPNLSLLGFTKASQLPVTVLYIDTERNINYQLPIAIRQILLDTGLDLETLKEKFTILPMMNVVRTFRTNVMGRQFSSLDKKDEKKHYVIFLDIVSDFVSDFNSVTDTFTLTDILNGATNTFDITFIVILHENPGAEKARGHLGTELSNKSSTVFQISETEAPDIVRVKILKSRNTRKFTEILLKFDESVNNLVIVDDVSVQLMATDPEMIKLKNVLGRQVFSKIGRKDLLDFVQKNLDWKERKIEDKLKKMVDLGIRIENIFGTAILKKLRGKTTEYQFVYLDSENSTEIKDVEK